MTYDQLKMAMDARSFATTKEWFAFLASHGWSGARLRVAADARRKERYAGTCMAKPIPPCKLCGHHHDTLAIAEKCQLVYSRQEQD